MLIKKKSSRTNLRYWCLEWTKTVVVQSYPDWKVENFPAILYETQEDFGQIEQGPTLISQWFWKNSAPVMI